VALLAFAADRLAAAGAPLLVGAGRAAIDQQQQTRRTLLLRSIAGTDTVPLHGPCCMLCDQCQ